MKIIGSRFRLSVRGRRQLLPATVVEVVDASVPAVAAEKQFKKKALLIGVSKVRGDDDGWTSGPATPQTPLFGKKVRLRAKAKKVDKSKILDGPHRDVQAMKALLIDTYKYDPSDITILVDDDQPEHVQPTRENILSAIVSLVSHASENDRFFFHFAGHSTQEDTDDIEEEDRKDEFILGSDGQTIKDDELRSHLVEPLPPKTSLIAVFDSCHSGSLLDLKHFRCNQVYVPWLNRGERRTKSLWYGNQRRPAQAPSRAEVATRAVKQASRLNSHLFKWTQTSIDQVLMGADDGKENIDTTSARVSMPIVVSKQTLSIITGEPLSQVPNEPSPSWLDSPRLRCVSPEMLYCSGDCRTNPLLRRGCEEDEQQPDVISLSAAADGQKAWEGSDGTSMTQALVEILRKDPHPSLHNLLTLVSHDLHSFYLTLHTKSREYRKQIRELNDQRRKKGKKTRDGDSVEMNNFQNPQLSSDRPLDMSRSWYP